MSALSIKKNSIIPKENSGDDAVETSRFTLELDIQAGTNGHFSVHFLEITGLLDVTLSIPTEMSILKIHGTGGPVY